MHDTKALLRDAAIEGISGMAQHLPEGCDLFVIACRPGNVDFDLVLPSPEANLNNALDALRRQGLSIDGANIYKDAVCDLAVGAMAMGKQNNNHPPEGHWGSALLGYRQGRGRTAGASSFRARKRPQSARFAARRRKRGSCRD